MSLPPHWSPTQSEMFAMCPERYRRRYVEGEKIPPGIALIRGSAVHKGAEVNLKHKRDNGVLLAEDAVLAAARDEFEARWQGGVLLTPEESSAGVAVTKGEAIDQTVNAARFHSEFVAPLILPKYVEAKVETKVDGLPRPLLGYVDVIETNGQLNDLKVSGKTPSEDMASSSVQLKHYALAYRAATGTDSPVQRLDYIVPLKKGTKHVRVETHNGPDDAARLIHRYSVQMEAIQHGAFPPATFGAWWCSEKWCGYFGTCRYARNPVTVTVAVGGDMKEHQGEREEDIFTD